MKNYIKILENYFKEQRKLQREIYWSQVFNSAIRNSEWLKDTAFNAGRWAIGFPVLYVLYRILDSMKPLSILEFGLGESSKMTGRYRNAFKDAAKIINSFVLCNAMSQKQMCIVFLGNKSQ
jgi:hypothetical protein